MTASATTMPVRYTGRPGLATTVAIGLVASATIFGLLISGVVFLALAVAFEIAVPVAHQYGVSVPAQDMAVAVRLAAFWWVPAAMAVASFFAAAVVAVLAVLHLDPAPRG